MIDQLPLAAVLDEAGDALGGWIPRLGGALALLVIGWIVAGLAARLVTRALTKLGLDDVAERWRVHDALERIGLPRSLARVLGMSIRIGARIVVVFASLSLLGLGFLSESINQAILFLPQLLVALALLLAGFVLASFARERVDRAAYQMDLPVPLGQVAYVVVLSIFAITAATQIAVSTAFLALMLAILVGASALTVALAFGLGGRDMARAVSAGRYVRGAHQVGERISVGEVTGVIQAIEPAATVLATGDGDEIRVPNQLLLESVVRVHAGE
jgi:small-conductance mechanosensitive channel